ncbi:hypothetical protein CHS0354_009832 [Potamilus streckersoni]|uniref:Rho guanine nucleotide exchange factor 28 n=1 Tax=Potamilus streckersoni TaxID=2493646 RepID=A0AAE0W346_9BIVA|nr:hypothetical protein CHS0354_009832 [Potamilus streckersoni]
MALSIDKAPVYGGNTLVVEFPVDVLLSREANYYIVYEGSIHRLLTGARVLTEHKLHSLVPAHREAEFVHQSILCYHGDSSSILATNVFHFYYDSAFYLAQFLIDSVYNPTSLEDFELIKSEHFDISNEDLSTLDQRLSRALSFLDIPDWWNLLGGDQNTAKPSPRETVLHFSARLGLNRVATYFLGKPGSQTALRLPNHQGNVPRDVALNEDYPGLAELLSEYNIDGLMPLSRRFVIESATIQTQETGDVILSTDLSKQHRHIDEDIALLCQVRRKLEQEESPIHVRQWQTDWPLREQQTDWPLPQPEQEYQYQHHFDSHHASQHLDEEFDHQGQVHQVVDILQKNHEIQDSLKNYVGYYENIDHFAETNFNDQQEENPFVSFPEDSVNMNSLYSVSANSLNQNEAESFGFGVSVGALRAYNEHLQQVCEQDVADNRSLLQDLRKQNLARFSSSCPSLDAEGRGSPLPTINEGDHSNSLYDLAEDSGSDGLEPTSVSHSDEFCTVGQVTSQPSIVISGASVDNTSDTRIQQQAYDSFLEKYYGGNVPNIRRRSWNPEDEIQKQKVTDQCQEGDEMLQYVGMSMSLSSLDERGGGVESEDNDSFQPGLKVGHVSPINHSAGAEGRRYITSSSGDSDFSRETGQDLSDMMRDVGEYVSVTSTPVQRWGTDGPACSQDQRKEMEIFVDSNSQGHHKQSPPESGDKIEEEKSGGTSQPPATYAPHIGAHHMNITKALSLSSIPNATDLAGNQGFFRKKQGRDGNKQQQLNMPSHLLIQKLVAEHDAQLQRQQETKEEAGFKAVDRGSAKSRTRKKGQVSLLDFLNESVAPSTEESRSGKKDEKKRKTSMFSRFNSYRKGKQKDKDLKNRSSHQFVSVSFSNNTPCDVCNKSMTNKPALCCETCLMNVHDSSCKDQVTTCSKSKHPQRAQRSGGTPGTPAVESDGMSAYGDKTGLSQSAPTHQALRPSYSFKEKRPVTLRPQSQVSVSPSGGSSVPPPSPDDLSQLSANGQIHRRSLPTPRRAITEEGETDSTSSGLDGDHSDVRDSNITQSTESLDQIDGGATPESGNDDHDLDQLNIMESETWSVTAEKKLLKKMSAKDIKRQDIIWELIQTEKHHCKTLVILSKLFRDQVLVNLGLPSTFVDRIFPRLDDLMEIHKKFLSQLRELQGLKPDRSIDEIGLTLISQFSGLTGEKMKAAYGTFCSGHKEAVMIYKDLLTTNMQFLSLVKRSNHPICEKREIPDFILLITQRPTKYPTLIESILKSTKDKKDRENLSRALELSKEILQSVDEQVADYERQMRLQEIYQKMDSKSTSVYRGKKFKKSDLITQGRRLVNEGTVGWKNARGKTTEVIAVLLTDVMFFMQESNQKYNFFSADNKYGVVPLFNLLVREKGDTRDSKGFYLISQNKQMPEMYELVCRTASERHSWITILQKTVEKCPEDENEADDSEDEEEKKREVRAAKVREIMEKMRENDEDIKVCCNEKNRLILELLAVYNSNEDSSSRPGSKEIEEVGLENIGTLQAAIQGVSIATSQLTTMLEFSSTNLSRSVSSVGEHSTSSFAALQVPKRAETFGGFDAPQEGPKVVLKKKLTAQDMESPRASLYRDESETESSQLQDSPTSGSVKFDSSHDVDSGRDSSPGGFSSASFFISPMSAHIAALAATQEQASIANLLMTLHSIVHLTASQSTAVESLRVQLAEANERINKLSADVHHERKSGYRHNQLEELRNLQSQIQKEKKEWEIQKDKERKQLEWERSLLDEQRKEQEKKEQEIKSQREDLRTEREKFQRQIDLLQQQGRLPRDMPLPKSLTSPNNFPSQLELAKRSSVDTEDSGQVQSNLGSDVSNGHRRSASADFYQSVPEDLEKIRQGKIESRQPKERRPSGHTQFGSSGKQALPEHLLSAKNEQRIGPQKVQKIPSKLASSSALTTTSAQLNLAKNTSGQLSQQPYGSHSNSKMMHHSASGVQITNMHGNNSFPQSGGSSQLGVSGANSSSSNYQNQSSHFPQSSSNVTVAKYSNRQSPTGSTSSLGLVLKLAEPGGGGGGNKTRTLGPVHAQEKHLAPQVTDQYLPRQQPAVTQGSEQQTPPRQPQSQGPERPISMGPEKFQGLNINHKPQKSDSDVIYF